MQKKKKKTDRATSISADVLQRTADEVQQGTSIRKAAASFNIDKMTLSRYIAKCKTQPQPSMEYAAVTIANYIIFILFYFYLYICPPDLQESDGGAIHRVSNYPDLLSEMPRYCCPLVI